MKVSIIEVATVEEEAAVIQAAAITDEIRNAVDLLENNCRSIPVIRENATIMCQTNKIYYIESVDKKTFIYTKEECFETKYRLYELEEILSNNFLRCSKAMICNIRKIKSVKSDFNGRMNAELLNGEQIVISRSYVKDLKKRLGL